VVVGVVVVAWMVVVGSITPTPSAKLVRSLHGSLVFTTGTERPGRGQLWVVDLDTGEVRPGPHVPTPTAVVRVPEGGYLVSTADGAWFLSSLDARVRPRFLAGRRTVGLAGDGRGVFVSSSGHITGGRCDYSVLESVEARSGDRERLFTSVCARVRNVGSDGIIDYLTLASDTGSGVYALGYREIHPVLRGYELLSVSPQGDLLVAPSPGDEEVVLFWQGRGSPVQVRSEGAPLEVEHALAWSTDGARAALLGSIRGTRAVWSIGSGPSARGDRPVQVSPRLDPDEVPGAAFDPEGRLFLATGGSLWVVRHGLRNEVPLPEDIPEPSGPLLWLP
jgi:WD40 repeat protein